MNCEICSAILEEECGVLEFVFQKDLPKEEGRRGYLDPKRQEVTEGSRFEISISLMLKHLVF